MRHLTSWIVIAFYSVIAQINAFVLCGLACGYAMATYAYIRLLEYEMTPEELRDPAEEELITGVREEHWEAVWNAGQVMDWESVAASMPIVGWYFLAGFAIGGPTFVMIINACTAWQLYKLRGGGKQLVEDLGASPLGPTSAVDTLEHLPEIVAQLASEFNVPAPAIHILSAEEGMNAFVVGNHRKESILVVTKGLRHLHLNQLRGIIAHEMAHLAGGDVSHNMRLLALTLGVNSVRHTAEWMLRTGWNAAFGGSSNHRSALLSLQWGCLLLLLGIILWPIGVISSIVGALMMAWSNRRQEFRADRRAACVLGSWEPIGDALKRIMGHNRRGRILGPECRKLGHLMFSQATGSAGGILSTHPKMERRIRRADRDWDGIPLFESEDSKRIDSCEMTDMSRVENVLADVSAPNLALFRDPAGLTITVPALLLFDEIHRQKIATAIDPKVREPVEMLCRCIEGMSEQARFALLELTLKLSISVGHKDLTAVLKQIEEALPTDVWFARCWLQVFLDTLLESTPPRVSLKNFRQCSNELAHLVSAGVGMGIGNHASSFSELRFQRVWMVTGLEIRPVIELAELEFTDVAAAVDQLAKLPTRFRETLVNGFLQVFDDLKMEQAAFLRYVTNKWRIELKEPVITMISKDSAEPQLHLRYT